MSSNYNSTSWKDRKIQCDKNCGVHLHKIFITIKHTWLLISPENIPFALITHPIIFITFSSSSVNAFWKHLLIALSRLPWCLEIIKNTRFSQALWLWGGPEVTQYWICWLKWMKTHCNPCKACLAVWWYSTEAFTKFWSHLIWGM